MTAECRPNERLRRLMAEAGWTGQQLACQVNGAGAEVGVPLRYGRAAVAHWLSGMRPRHPVPGLIAEALSRRLGRPVSVVAAGLAAGPVARLADAAQPGQAGAGSQDGSGGQEADAVMRLVKLNADLNADRRRILHGAYSLAALAVPGCAQAAAAIPPARHPRGQAGTAQADSAEAMTGVFSEVDSAFGGGCARVALSGYLALDIAPWLRARMSPAVRRRMFGAAAELAYLCAFMCFDQQLNGAAQHYYQAAMRLTADNGDAVAYAVTLRAMSVQAYSLGHRLHALHLAEAALSGTPARIKPGTHAFLQGQAAVAAAGTGDRRSALTRLGAAERLLERASSPAGNVGGYHQAALAHQHAEVLAALGDRPGAARALAVCIRHRPPSERRARAITRARLAGLQLDQGHLEEASATWQNFLDDYPHLRSGRADAALGTLRARLRPYRRNTAA